MHAAASYKDPEAWAEDAATNTLGTANVVRAAERADVERLIYFQTALCYGTQPLEQPITLDHPLRPDSSYAISKTAGEQYIELSRLDWVSLRLANAYGPRNVSGPLPTFFSRLTSGKPCFVMDTRRDFIFVDDLIEVVLAALDGTGHGHYHVASGSDYAIKELFDATVAALGIELDGERRCPPPLRRRRLHDPARPLAGEGGLRLGAEHAACGRGRSGDRRLPRARNRRDLHPPQGRRVTLSRIAAGLWYRGKHVADAPRRWLAGMLARRRRRRGREPDIRRAAPASNDVDSYWGEVTVMAPSFLTRRGSERFLEWRFAQYPLFREFSGLWGDHSGEVVLDYGCGPGNDLTGLLLHSDPAKVIGIDVSAKALAIAARRVALHGIDKQRIELIQVSDAGPEIPLADDSIDHLNCQGVLMATSEPARLLAEFRRVLKPGGTGCVMVYNRDSVWYHLYVPYEKTIVDGTFAGLDTDAAFARSTDGPECPISEAWTAGFFRELCAEAGFEADYRGGYPNLFELDSLKRYRAAAVEDPRLADEHRAFVREVTLDPHGYPLHDGVHAGLSGVFHLGSGHA